MMEFVLGFMACAWLMTLFGVSYTLWRYAFKPFEALKGSLQASHQDHEAKLAAISQRVEAINAEIGLRKALVLDDETVARAETRLRARQQWGIGANSGG